jgi:ribonuclease BN (tRNA processing enzyme)
LRDTELPEYELEHAKNGEETLAKLSSFHPHLVIVTLMLPGMDGIEILRRIRLLPDSSRIGVVLASYEPMVQVYHAAIELGANYFLVRPCSPEQIRTICRLFFTGHLHPDPFQSYPLPGQEGEHCYVPRIHTPDRYIRFWGTRGSCPVSGSEYLRYGGNTSCLEVRAGRDLIILDAGSGIRPLGDDLAREGIRHVHLFFGHTHWDHIIGFPFFAPLYDPDVHISVWAPVGYEKGIRELFVEMLAYAYFPIRLEDIRAKVTFHELRDSQKIEIGHLHIYTHYTFHPGSTLCFKIKTGKTSFGYVTDNEMLMGYHGHPDALQIQDPLLNPHHSLIHFLKNVDMLIHEAQYDPFEYLGKVGWGHSSISNAAVLVKYCQPHEWIVTHHDPRHTDSQLQKKLEIHSGILEDSHIDAQVRMAYDGFMLPI